MNLLASVRIALRALGANKLRASLTMLGMIIGVGAVIAMISIGNGAQNAVNSQIEALGTNLLYVTPGQLQQTGVTTASASQAAITYADAKALADSPDLPIAGVAPEQTSSAQVLARGINVNTRVNGTTPDYEWIRNAHVADGEFITQEYLDADSLVAVLGANVAKSLFGEDDPIDQTIRINIPGRSGVNFRVIGVMEPKGGGGFGSQDDVVFVPITTKLQRLATGRTVRGSPTVSTISVQVNRDDQMAAATAQIGELLRERHRVEEDDFTILSQKDFLALAGSVTGIMTILLGSIAGISLVVGGIGIMNIMLVSVTERTREIGIRKAIGARRRDVLFQFLIEAVVVAIVGGALGILLGGALSQLVSGIDIGGGTKLTVTVTMNSVLLAVGVSAGIGLFFGIFPAARAAQLNPIEALRYE